MNLESLTIGLARRSGSAFALADAADSQRSEDENGGELEVADHGVLKDLGDVV